jgi:hypothetical protein
MGWNPACAAGISTVILTLGERAREVSEHPRLDLFVETVARFAISTDKSVVRILSSEEKTCEEGGTFPRG